MADEDRFNIGVIGLAHADTIFTATSPVINGHTSPATSVRKFGGVGYNIAEPLVKLGEDVGLLFVKAGDQVADLVDRNLQSQRIKSAGTILVPGSHTAFFNATYDANGEFVSAVIVDDISKHLTVKMLAQHIGKLKSASMWVTDSAFSHEVYAYLATVAAENNIDVYVVISSINGVANIEPLLHNCKGLFGNVEELSQLAKNYDATEAGIWRTLEILAEKGVEGVFANPGKKGILKGIYALVNEQRYQVKAQSVEHAVSPYGVGDIFAATVVHCLKQGQRVQQAIETGLAAVTLKMQAKEFSKKTLEHAMSNAATDLKNKRKAGKMLFHKLHSL